MSFFFIEILTCLTLFFLFIGGRWLCVFGPKVKYLDLVPKRCGKPRTIFRSAHKTFFSTRHKTWTQKALILEGFCLKFGDFGAKTYVKCLKCCKILKNEKIYFRGEQKFYKRILYSMHCIFCRLLNDWCQPSNSSLLLFWNPKPVWIYMWGHFHGAKLAFSLPTFI